MNHSLELLQIQMISFEQELSHYAFNFFTQKPFGFTCLVVIVYAMVQKANHHSLFGSWIANLFGVFFHELVHALIGAFLYAKPNRFIIIPHSVSINNQPYYNLGRVEFENLRWFNAFPTSLAPLLLLPLAYYLEANYWNMPFVKHELSWLFLYVYLQIVLIINSIPSIIDFENAFKNPFSTALWVILVIYGIKNIL